MRKSVVCTDADVELVHAAPCVPACQRYVWGGCEICDAWRIRAGVTEPVQRHGQAESSHARYLAIRPYCSPGTDGYPTKIPSTSPLRALKPWEGPRHFVLIDDVQDLRPAQSYPQKPPVGAALWKLMERARQVGLHVFCP